jgi:hypothetical protein
MVKNPDIRGENIFSGGCPVPSVILALEDVEGKPFLSNTKVNDNKALKFQIQRVKHWSILIFGQFSRQLRTL